MVFRIFKCLAFASLAICMYCFLASPGRADITTDGTVGPALSLDGPDYMIGAGLGRQEGGNLFHSFGQFDIHTGESATFTGPDSVENILSRVTGGQSSWIDGLLRSTIPGADFYLLNPAGVMFGPNASLSVGGAFHVSTADYLRLGETGRFDARHPEQSTFTSAPPSAFGFLGENPSGITLSGTFAEVSEGEAISVVGGDIHLHDTTLLAEGGRISLASTASPGEVRLTDGGIETDSQKLGEIAITRESDFIWIDESSFYSDVEVSGIAEGQSGGAVFIRGGRFELRGGRVGADTLGDKDSGGIHIQVENDVEVDASGISHGGLIRSGTKGAGDAGDIEINAEKLSLKNGGHIYNGTKGAGDGGKTLIKVSDKLTASGAGNALSGILADSSSKSADAGKAGNIEIEAGQITLSNGAQIDSSTYGPGEGGKITVRVSDGLTASGTYESSYIPIPSGIIANSSGKSADAGKAGNIEIEADHITLSNGARIDCSTYGTGRGGNINIDACNISLYDGGVIASRSYRFGKGGNIFIKLSDTLNASGVSGIYSDLPEIESKESDIGEAGSIEIQARQIILNNKALISSATKGKGDGGDIEIQARQIILNNKALISSATKGKGDGGNINIDARNISLYDGGMIDGGTRGPGKGGNIFIKLSDTLNASGISEMGGRSGIYNGSLKMKANTGEAGRIEIQARQITLDEGALIFSATGGEGNGGDIVIKVTDTFKASGRNEKSGTSVKCGIFGGSGGHGKAGNLEIEAGRIILTEGALIESSSSGPGDGGKIVIRASDALIASGTNETGTNPSGILVSSGSEKSDAGNAGDIEITANQIILKDGAKISGRTLGSGKGGSVRIKNTTKLFISDKGIITTSSQGEGKAGDISIDITQLQLSNDAIITSESTPENTSVEKSGDAGTITIAADETIRLSGNSSLTTRADVAGGGKMVINAEEQIYLKNSQMLTEVRSGAGNAGDIHIDPEFVVLDKSKIIANAYEGRGGNIRIVADYYIASPDSVVEASSEKGIDGVINISSPDVNISGSLAALPARFLDVSQWMKSPCATRSGERVSHFTLTRRDAVPTAPDDWLASPLPLPDRTEESVFRNISPNISEALLKGEKFCRKGDFEQAVTVLEQALTRLPKAAPLRLHTLAWLSHACQALGHHKRALSRLRKALPFVEAGESSSHKALVFNSLGDIYLSVGEIKQAEKYLQKAAEQAESANDAGVMASVQNNLANMLAADEAYLPAKESYQKSLGLIRRALAETGLSSAGASFLAELRSKVHLNMARLALDREEGDAPDIQDLLKTALHQTQSLPDARCKASDLISLSLLARKANNKLKSPSRSMTDMAYRTLIHAGKIAEPLHDSRLASYASGYLGQLYEETHHYAEAMRLTRKALFFAQQRYCPELLYYWQWQTGRLFRAEGHTDRAAEAYAKAVETLNPIRREFFTGYRSRRNAFSEKVKPVYLGLAELLLEQTDTARKDEADAENSLIRAMDVMEFMKAAEIQDFFQDECITALPRMTRLDRTPPHTAVLYPIIFRDHLTLLLTLPDAVKAMRIAVDSDTLRQTAARLGRRLQQERWKGRFRPYACKLYGWLIRPVEAELTSRHIDTLIIAPDGPLRMIPFAALHDGKHFLIEKYALATIPAITLTDPQPIDLTDARLLLNGLSEARMGFSPLPGVPDELRSIRKMMGGKILQDADYTLPNLTEEFRNRSYSVLHMATHGMFGDTPEKTFLLTYDGRLTMNRLEQLIRLGRFRERPVELLSLSACQTARGNERAALGLAGVALRAGVRSAIATLWFIDDKAASLVIREFYRQISRSGMSKAKALRNAQRKLIASPDYSHPAYWAPFLLIGNWL